MRLIGWRLRGAHGPGSTALAAASISCVALAGTNRPANPFVRRPESATVDNRTAGQSGLENRERHEGRPGPSQFLAGPTSE